MIMDAQTRSRPNLEVRTDYMDERADGLPRTAFRSHRSPLPSLSPLTAAKPVPSPLHPSMSEHGGGMRQHERVMVDSLDRRARQDSIAGESQPGRSRSPIAEQAMAARVGYLSMDSPLSVKSPTLPLTAPNTPRNQQVHRDAKSMSMVDETRSMLLSGMSASQANDLGAVVNRRLSASTDVSQDSRRQSLSMLQPDMLQAWGHVYFNEPAKADVFVEPSALRRPSGDGQTDAIEGNHMAIRARIRPKNKDRKPFLIARSFDLGELRSTLPTASNTLTSLRRQSGVPISPDDLSTAARTPTTPLTPLIPSLALGRRRSSIAASGLRGSRVGSHQSKGSSKEMPVHLVYARSYLPALAALMMSGHIKAGDAIDLPMPHPEAWPQTLAYVYTGCGDLTEAVRRNILHLGGRV
ncbi:unnamed protein product [Discula destructiva]